MRRLISNFVFTVLVGAFLVLSISTIQSKAESCFPTCSSVDARFLALTEGDVFATLTPDTLNIRLVVPAGVETFSLGIFDGDHQNGFNTGGEFNWDSGPASELYNYAVKIDPDRDNNGATVFGVQSSDLPDNNWADFNITNDPAAQDADGNHVYTITITHITGGNALNAFKIRTDVGILEIDEIFTFVANMGSLTDIPIVYPEANFLDGFQPEDLNGTTYDGTFTFFFDIAEPAVELVFWDGDTDIGNFDGTTNDTDDLNTPNNIPAFSPPGADTLPEGINIADPFDDLDPAGNGGFNFFFTKSPAVTYSLISPTGTVFHNPNPSGNQEWENFVISALSDDPTLVDFNVPEIPAGSYEIRFEGLDITNIVSINPLFPIVLRGEVIPPPGPGEPGFMPEAAAVPTISEWGLIAVAIAMAIIGIVTVRRRHQVS